MEKEESETDESGVKVHGTCIKDLRFANDVDLLAETEE